MNPKQKKEDTSKRRKKADSRNRKSNELRDRELPKESTVSYYV